MQKRSLLPRVGVEWKKPSTQYKDKFKGILNGIDYSYWNPEIDRYLPAHFSSREMPPIKKTVILWIKKPI